MQTSVIYGLEGLTLNAFERSFFKAQNPFGFILFARNCDTPAQVKALVASLKELTGRADTPILIDQEGGRVQRLKPPFCPKYPAAKLFSDMYKHAPENAIEATYLGMRLVGDDLYQLGINVDCVPCADLFFTFAHEVIGDRAYGNTPKQVSVLADSAFRGLKDSGVAGVLKHIPGHGRAKADSHFDLPVVDTSFKQLKKTDFQVFRKLANTPFDFAMTAHVVYTAIDKECATFSKPVIDQVVKGFCDFKGLIMSDDVSMKALTGTFESRVTKAYYAGCDLILHCNGKQDEMEAIASKARKIAPLNVMKNYSYEPFDKANAKARFNELTGFAL